MATILITLDEAKAHIREDAPTVQIEADLTLKMAEAEETVLTFLEHQDTGWTSDTVPADVKAAILLVLTHLWEHRGDEDQGEAKSINVRSLLRMWRVPVFA